MSGEDYTLRELEEQGVVPQDEESGDDLEEDVLEDEA